MKLRESIIILLLTLFSYTLYGIEVAVMPLMCFDEDDGRKIGEVSPQRDLLRSLHQYDFGSGLLFGKAKEDLVVQTNIDAARAGAILRADYLLYGYVRRGEVNWFAEIKLYNCTAQRVEEIFFASDAREEYGRLVSVLAEHITDHMAKTTGRSRGERDKVSEFAVRLPIHVGYWTYTNAEWAGYVHGAAAGGLGVDFYPEMQFPPLWGRHHELSVGLGGEYRYGVGAEEGYALDVHEVSLYLPVTYRFWVTGKNGVSLGAGPFVEWQVWRIQEKHEDGVWAEQVLIGVMGGIGYRYRINKTITVDGGTNMYFYLSKLRNK